VGGWQERRLYSAGAIKAEPVLRRSAQRVCRTRQERSKRSRYSGGAIFLAEPGLIRDGTPALFSPGGAFSLAERGLISTGTPVLFSPRGAFTEALCAGVMRSCASVLLEREGKR